MQKPYHFVHQEQQRDSCVVKMGMGGAMALVSRAIECSNPATPHRGEDRPKDAGSGHVT
jgi:hypothetical protein